MGVFRIYVENLIIRHLSFWKAREKTHVRTNYTVRGVFNGLKIELVDSIT